MADARELARRLIRAVGAAAIAVAVIDNARDGCPTCAAARAELTDALSSHDLVQQQSCPHGVHRDWWADTDGGAPIECPWCQIDDLHAAQVGAA